MRHGPRIPTPASARGKAAALLTLALLLGACDPASDPVAPFPDPAAALLADGTDLREILSVALEDEYRAEAIYLGVMKDFGSVLPFRNIARAEAQHARNVAALFVARGLAVPANAWSPANVPHFATLKEACRAGVTAELENIALYDRYLGLRLPTDVLSALTRNRRASLQAHLPAFRRCS